MPCSDCASVRVELLSMKEFMSQWFQVLMQKMETVEQQNDNLKAVVDKLTPQSQTPIDPETQLEGSQLQRSDGRQKRRVNSIGGFSMSLPRSRHPPPLQAPCETKGSTSDERTISEFDSGHESGDPSLPVFGDVPAHMDSYHNQDVGAAIEEEEGEGLEGYDDEGQLLLHPDDSSLSPNEQQSGPREVSTFLAAISCEQESSSRRRFVSSTTDQIIRQRSVDGRFHCRLCQQSFTQLSNLRRHCRVLHQDVPQQYPCRYCGKRFNWKGAWKRHEYIQHNSNPTTTNNGHMNE